MDLDPILSALSKLEQSIKDRYNDLNDKYNDLNNKITKLNLSYQLSITFRPLLQLSMLQLQILLKRQNDFPLNRC